MKKNKFKKQLILTVLTLLSSSLVIAQSAGAAGAVDKSESSVMNAVLANGLIFFAGLTMLGALLALSHLLSMMIKVQQLKIYQEQGMDAYLEKVEQQTKEPFWKRQYKAWTNVVPVEKENTVMLDHDYDGIRELDNSLPPWWVAMFYITIALGVVFLTYYHVLGGPSQSDEYTAEVKVAEQAKAAFAATQANNIDEDNLEASTDEKELAIGKTVYTTNCVACHGANGEGGVGPNLTDEFWIHGGGITNVFKTVKNGVPEKGMIAWSAQLKPSDIHKVASYILTLQGSNPPNGKEPQGDKYVAEETAGDDSMSEN